ncbi:disease resistance protein RPM1-like [Pistacia vera]|uniref:disease resistance protein RPM1-like n=1 Tax=Pistacia vera TaxID=55513 RepID=UPI001263653C|nr:disease resistance protein RPM1-like [Pistacia vera]
MAEFAVYSVIQILSSLLVQEIKLLGNAKQGVEDIKRELESIRSLLKDADTRAAQEGETGSSEGVKTWVKQLREEAFRIEDAIDEYTMTAARLPHGRSLLGYIHKSCYLIKIVKLRHEFTTEIKDIKLSLAEIRRRGEIYSFRYIDQGSGSAGTNVIPHDSRVDSFFIEDAEVVGIESTKEKLISLLVEGTSNIRLVIAIVGEGGLGKTTLAGKVYNNDAVKKHFDCQAWITVGKEYLKKDLLRTILQEIYRLTGSTLMEVDKMEEMDLIMMLREHLKDKCYMIVFDDVWKIEFWRDVEHALLDNKKKNSRVMLTTRNNAIAEFIPFSIVQIHKLEPLSSEEGWKLFCRKAFGSDDSCPPNLKELSAHIIGKCGGLPLAIVAIGGLLSRKNKIVSEWRNILDALGSKLSNDSHFKDCNKVLSEGYYDLPHHLKSCLLYFGVFPEGYEIRFGRLIRLWIAEGFVQCNNHLPSEHVAEEYLKELIDRSLVQVSKRKASGRVASCRVHDLMYEIICRKMKECDFCHFFNENNLSYFSKTRRISIHKCTNGVLESTKNSKIRSIYLFNVDKLPESFMTTFVADFKLLKILDFENAPLDCLPDGVGKLFHLHYLSLRNTKVKELPKSIGMLLNLETLDLKWTFVSELPVEIKNLKKLCCLIVRRWDDKGPYGSKAKIQEGFGALTELKKLWYVHTNTEVLEELRKLRQMRKLAIRVTNRDVKDLFAIVQNMESLEDLSVSAFTSGQVPLDIQSLASPPLCLQQFHLGRIFIESLPVWISKLQNLIRLQLDLVGFTNDSMTILQALPNLLVFILFVDDCSEQLHFKEGWFPKLQYLYLKNFKGLKCMIIEKGAMSSLTDLWIGPCPLLKEIPTGIEHLNNLKILVFLMMLKKVYYMIKNENWENVTKHIPQVRVTVSYKEISRREYFFYTCKDLSSLSAEDFEKLIEENEAE